MRLLILGWFVVFVVNVPLTATEGCLEVLSTIGGDNGKVSDWNGFARCDFQCDGRSGAALRRRHCKNWE